tara:strand:+ start:332 stop:463 length:132 start_codon:yes stop_codon:yes gene_type:complete
MKTMLAALFLLAVQLVPAAEPVAYKIEFSMDAKTIFVSSLAGK